MSLWMGTASAQSYVQTNLVSSTAGAAPLVDSQLSGPMGFSRLSSSEWWVSDSTSGFSTLYIGDGTKNPLVVTVPPARAAQPGIASTGSPAGAISNNSPTDFLVGGKPAAFLFSTLDGAIAAWNPAVGAVTGPTPVSNHAEIVATGAPGSIYPAIASAFVNGKRILYAANFGLNRIDTYDSTFRPVRLPRGDAGPLRFDSNHFYADGEPFVDDRLPGGYSPYNVQAIGNDIVVTYAFHPDRRSTSPASGPGLGYVDVFSASGILLARLEHGDFMDAPYGVALAPLDFGRFSHDLLVAQSGTDNGESSGVIAAFDFATGKFDGEMKDATGKTLVIPGLRGIAPGNVSPANLDAAAAPAAQLYFTSFSGQAAQSNALFGFLAPATADLIKGNDQ
ncbi:TIGR03118 family protein [Paraburkholderia jirisanensis]